MHTQEQQELHRAFLVLWDKAVGTTDYNKAEWKRLDELIQKR